MAETPKVRRVVNGLTTIVAVWLALTISGLATILPVTPGPVGMAALTLALYSGLLALYAFATKPGRHSGFGAFLAGALLYPAYIVALIYLVEALGSGEQLWGAMELAGAGISVGFQVEGGADTPIFAYLVPWLLNFTGPIVLVLGLRTRFRGRAAESSGG